MDNASGSPTLTNVILWGNVAMNSTGIYNDSGTPTIYYSDIQCCIVSGSWTSTYGTNSGGNIDADPLFVYAAVGDRRLQVTSPAIDAGNNNAVPAGTASPPIEMASRAILEAIATGQHWGFDNMSDLIAFLEAQTPEGEDSDRKRET